MRFTYIVLLLVFAGLACADTGGDIADDINNVICLFVRLVWLVTGSLMALVIIFAGVKWLVSGEDAGARASAKTFIVSAFVGLIIIFTAVPVVDYLVGGILGYGFSCGFFPEVDMSASVLGGGVAPVGEDKDLYVKSVDPLSESVAPDLYVEAAGFSGGDLGGELFCVVIGEQGGHTSAADVEVVVSLDEVGVLELDEICRETIPLVDAGGFAQVACPVDPEKADLVKANPGNFKFITNFARILRPLGRRGIANG